MGTLDDTSIFVAIVEEGGFSHAAKKLGLSNGLISRRIAQLETQLGVTLIKRTTRRLNLTPEGELFWKHAQRIQQEFDSAINLIQLSAGKPKGIIRISAPVYFGRHYLTPIIIKFLNNFNQINIDLVLSNKTLDPIKNHLDLVIRGTGYLQHANLQDSAMHAKLLLAERIGLYANNTYLQTHGEPKNLDELAFHHIVNFIDKDKISDKDTWFYYDKNKKCSITIAPKMNVNDIESSLIACCEGYGIGKFTDLNVKNAMHLNQLRPILKNYDWGSYHLYAIYSRQQALPKRSRLLLDFIYSHTLNLLSKKID
jgi:LysR family transcriptional regulator, transcriptional activator for dmlA